MYAYLLVHTFNCLMKYCTSNNSKQITRLLLSSGNQMKSTSGQTDVKESSKEYILCEKLIYKNHAWGEPKSEMCW